MTIRSSFLRVALLAVATLLPVALLTAPAVSASTPEGSYANQARKATNSQRTSRHLAALSRSACLQRFAVAQATKMAQQRRIFHQPLEPILSRCGMSTVGENVAYGYSNGNAVVQGWMGSPGHRDNILRPAYQQMGLAARRDGSTWYVAQVFGRPQ